MNDILKQIDQLVADKTFSLDALEGVKNIRDALIEAEKTNKQLSEENSGLLKLNDSLDRSLADERSKNQALREEIDGMRATIVKGQEAIYNAQKHEAVAAAWKEAMQTVFKPNTVRESVTRSIPVAQSQAGGGSYVSNYNDSSTIVREDC